MLGFTAQRPPNVALEHVLRISDAATHRGDGERTPQAADHHYTPPIRIPAAPGGPGVRLLGVMVYSCTAPLSVSRLRLPFALPTNHHITLCK